MSARLWTYPGATLLLLSAAVADDPSPLDFSGPVRAHVERVIDGDTIEVKAAIWLGQTIDIRVRIEGIDAPELKGLCTDEIRRAGEAREFLSRRLAGVEIELSEIAYDKYGGRVLARVADAKGDIGEALVALGLARAYGGGKRMPWCGG